MYNTSSSQTLDSNALWKFYQNGKTDSVVTPAYLLVLPTDNAKILNHLNFKDIGTNTLKASQSFRKIRQSSKTFTSNLVLSPTTLTTKYNTLADLYLKDNNLTGSLNYGNRRQHNFTSTLMSANVNRLALDTQSSNTLLSKTFNASYESPTRSSSGNLSSSFVGNYSKSSQSQVHLTNTLNLTQSENNTKVFLTKSINYNDLPSLINNNTDKRLLNQPLRKLLNTKTLKTANHNLPTNLSSFIVSSNVNPVNEDSVTSTKLLTTNSGLAKETIGTQTVRQAVNTTPTTAKLNYSLSLNPYNHLLNNTNTLLSSPLYTNVNTQDFDRDMSSRVLANRFSVDFTTAPGFSNNPLLTSRSFDSLKARKMSVDFNGTNMKTSLARRILPTSYIVSGTELNALDSLRQSY